MCILQTPPKRCLGTGLKEAARGFPLPAVPPPIKNKLQMPPRAQSTFPRLPRPPLGSLLPTSTKPVSPGLRGSVVCFLLLPPVPPPLPYPGKCSTAVTPTHIYCQMQFPPCLSIQENPPGSPFFKARKSTRLSALLHPICESHCLPCSPHSLHPTYS